MKWTVKNYNCNKDKIEDYDLFPYFETFLRELKKKKKTKEEFAKEIRSELMYHFWSRAQYELIVEIRENDRIYLLPWCGCSDIEAAAIDVTDDKDFDWKGFAEKHTKSQVYGNSAKIDIWDQVEYRFEEFVSYCWDGIQTRKRKKAAAGS